MESVKIQVTSNSTPKSIQQDFQNFQQITKLDLSLEIHVDQEELILKSIIDQIHQNESLENISIILEPFCVIEHFQVFAEGLSKLKFIKTLQVKFSSACFAGLTQFQHLASAIKSLSLLTNLSILIDEKNYFDKSQVALLSECFSILKELTTLKIQIAHGNSFSDQAITELSKGLANISNLQDLSLSLDFSNIYSQGMAEFSDTIKSFKQLNKLELTFLNKCAAHTSIHLVFESITTFSQLKSLLIDTQNTVQLESSLQQNIIQSFSNLTQLESLTLKNFIRKQETEDNQLLIKTISNLLQLKYLDTQIINFNFVDFDNNSQSSDYLINLINLTNLTLEISDTWKTRDNQFISILSKSITQMKELLSLKIEFQCKTDKIQSLSFMNSIKELTYLNTLDIVFSDKFYLDEDVYHSLGESLSYLLKLKSISLQIKYSNKDCRLEKKIYNKNELLKSLAKLSQLEVLQLKGIQVYNQQNETSFQNLITLKKLRIETKLDFTLTNITETFSKSLGELKHLTDLSFILYNNRQEKRNEHLNFFNFLAELNDLENLKLYIHYWDDNIFKSLGNALSSLSKLVNVKIKCRSCSPENLSQVVSGLQSKKLKQLTLNLHTLNVNTKNLVDYENMFVGISNLEVFKLEALLVENTFDFGQMLFRGLSKITNLISIDINLLFCQICFSLQSYQFLRDCLQKQQNLLSFRLKGELPYEDDIVALNLFSEGLKQSKNIRVFKVTLSNVNSNLFSFINSIQSKANLRKSKIKTKMSYFSFDQTQISNFKSLDSSMSSKYLTELRLHFSKFESDGDALVSAFRNIKNFQYLNLLLIVISNKPSVTNNALSVLGQSLQCIQNLQNLILKCPLDGNISEGATLQFAMGIRCQQDLQQLVFNIYSLNINEFARLNSIAQSIKYLANLQTIDFNFNLHSEKENEISTVDFFDILGKSLTDQIHLKVFLLKIDYSANAFKEGVIQLGDFLSKNTNLQKFVIEMETEAEVSSEGTLSLSQGQGISNLKQLQDLQIIFGQNEKISNEELLNFVVNLKELESLRCIKLEFFANSAQNPALVNAITTSLAQLKLLEKVELIFHNFWNDEQRQLELESFFKSKQISQFVEGKFSSTANADDQFQYDFMLENNGFFFSLMIAHESEGSYKEYILQIERLAEHIPKGYNTKIVLANILTEDLDDLVKIISQIQSKDLDFTIKWHDPYISIGLNDILQAISNMVNLTNLSLNLIDNHFSHELIINSVSQLSKSSHLKYLKIIHEDKAEQRQERLDLSTFNKYIRVLGEFKNLTTLIIHSQYFTSKFYVPAFKLINQLLPKLVQFTLLNEYDFADESDNNDNEEFYVQSESDIDFGNQNNIPGSIDLNEKSHHSNSKNEDELMSNEECELIEEEKVDQDSNNNQEQSNQELENSDVEKEENYD